MSSKDLDLNKQGVKVITLKAAKGLEFPIVAIAGFLDATYPTIPKSTSEDEITEILARDRRTLFVGMTRAMRALLVIVPASNSSLLLEKFDFQFLFQELSFFTSSARQKNCGNLWIAIRVANKITSVLTVVVNLSILMKNKVIQKK